VLVVCYLRVRPAWCGPDWMGRMAKEPKIRTACLECAKIEQELYDALVIPMGNQRGAHRCYACWIVPNPYYLVDFRHSAGVVA
jgi:hypothetical protein